MSLATLASPITIESEFVASSFFQRESSRILKFGEILRRRNLITAEKLELALKIQRSSEQTLKLGEILVANNLITQLDLQTVLMEQAWRKHGFWVID
ncbi:MAG: hypothetical protein AAGE59_18965 [Cyanobacteria bacterium P01_F01_bin.86]